MQKQIKTSRYEGVYFHTKHQQWAAIYKREWIGLFDSEDEAKRYRDSFITIYEERAKNGTLVTSALQPKLRGVMWCEKVGRWRTRIYINGKAQHVGYYDNETEAAEAYNQAARKFLGNRAKLNEVHS